MDHRALIIHLIFHHILQKCGSDNANGIFEKTICMDTVEGSGQRHYDVDNLYGISMAKATLS